MIRTLLVANRAEIARRVMRTARAMGIRTVAVYTEEDVRAPHTREADLAVAIDDYLSIGTLVDVARRAGADAVHPGYGFLSERAAAAEAFATAGITWVGPPASVIEALGDKINAKRIMADAGVPQLRSGSVADVERIGLPVLVKAAAGGGGRGMRLVSDATELTAAVASASREAQAAFGDGTVFLERWLPAPRHVEVQVIADASGHAMHLGERECSIQRRHQKIVEESPSPGISPGLRERMLAAAVAGAKAIGYVGAGTWEFLVDGEDFYFLEVNTRLQVEHPVTEAVTGLDLVRLQLQVAAGSPLPPAMPEPDGHAIEVRLVAEDPAREWLPSTGTIGRLETAELAGVRYDLGFETGSVISPRYDSLIGKVIAHGATRDEAAARLALALDLVTVHGVITNRALLAAVLREPDFLAGRTDTGYLDAHPELATGGRDHSAAAIAATLWRQAQRRSGHTLPSGWRNVRSQGQRTAWRAGADVLEVDYVVRGAAFAATVGERETRGRVLGWDGDGIRVESDGVLAQFVCTAAGDDVWVSGVDDEVLLEAVARFPTATSATGDRRGPTAPVPGTVIAIEVAAGDAVAAGQTLVVLEAMKLEHRIRAEVEGVVRAIPVTVGQRVDAHQLLVELEDG